MEILPNGVVLARCPHCNAHAAFQPNGNVIMIDGSHQYQGKQYTRILFSLLSCGGCRHGLVAKIHDSGNFVGAQVECVYPAGVERADLPKGIPEGIEKEFREAELCAAHGAWRAASALLRSSLEKTLKANGYVKGELKGKIDEASGDGVLTDARRKRAHEDIRVLGNDVLHDDWRAVTTEEYDQAHHYAQRILEDFYDDRDSVETVLTSKKRIAGESA